MQQIKLASEQHHLSALRTRNNEVQYDVYKACIAVANNGITLPEEKDLSPVEKNLLEVRRQLFVPDLKKAEEILRNTLPTSILLKGDHLFLQGQVHHRKGAQTDAAKKMNEAADQYRLLKDFHRELRARVNGALCLSSLESCLYGDLSVYEQEARQANFLDIAANICRTRAIELLAQGRSLEAYSQAMEASSLYQLDGYRDDRAVAQILAAICMLTLGEMEKAITIRSEALVDGGKTKVYIEVYDDLLSGKVPKLPVGHSLSKISWKKVILKSESVPGKIIDALRTGAKTRDELIFNVWGENAMSQSYCNRLYSAINAIRKEGSFTIVFDGESYNLIL